MASGKDYGAKKGTRVLGVLIRVNSRAAKLRRGGAGVHGGQL